MIGKIQLDMMYLLVVTAVSVFMKTMVRQLKIETSTTTS